MEKEVFISYSSRDQQIADELVSVIESNGASCWIAHRDIIPGADWAESINTALDNCKIFVLVFSKHSSASVQVAKEITIAVSGNKKIIPYKIDETPLEGAMRYNLCDTHWFDASNSSGTECMTELSKLVVSYLKSDIPVAPKTAGSGTAAVRSVPGTVPLLKRAFMFLEDGEWDSADAYCEKVLDMDPENAQAYLGKLLSELRIRIKDDLKDCDKPFDKNNNYQKAVRFADDKLKAELTGYVDHIKERIEFERKKKIYNQANLIMLNAYSEKNFNEAADLFSSIVGFMDAAALAEECRAKAKDSILNQGKAKMGHHTLAGYSSAIKLFESISGWKDADESIVICKQRYEELKAQKEAERAEKQRKANIAAEKAKRVKKIRIISLACVSAIIVIAIIFAPFIVSAVKYRNAINLMKLGEFDESHSIFRELGDYRDSKSKLKEIRSIRRLEETKNQLKNVQVGDSITFGEYNGKSLEWIVLEVTDGKALLISKYAVETREFNGDDGNAVAWETCSLRSWLNNEFMDLAFGSAEESIVSATTVSADTNPKYDTNAGNATQDQVFLLSGKEAEQFFSSNYTRLCKTDELASQGCRWWLRTPGNNNQSVSYVDYEGVIRYSGRNCYELNIAVRPAMWVEIES